MTVVNRIQNFRLITCHHEWFQMLNYEFTYDKFNIKSFIRHENETTIESDSRLLNQKLKWNNWLQNMTPTGCNMIKFMQIISRAENESFQIVGVFFLFVLLSVIFAHMTD